MGDLMDEIVKPFGPANELEEGEKPLAIAILVTPITPTLTITLALILTLVLTLALTLALTLTLTLTPSPPPRQAQRGQVVAPQQADRSRPCNR